MEDTEFEHGTSTLDEDYERSIKNAQEGTKHHWRKEKGVWKIKKNWDNPERIMLSLLRAYPSCKSLGEIGTDTDLSSGYISNIIAGRRGDLSEFFKKCDEGYKLSEEGIYYFIDLEKVRDYFVSLDG